MYITSKEWKSLVTLVAKAGAVVTDQPEQDGNDEHIPTVVALYKINDLHDALLALMGNVVGASRIKESDYSLWRLICHFWSDKPNHITTGDVRRDLGWTQAECDSADRSVFETANYEIKRLKKNH